MKPNVRRCISCRLTAPKEAFIRVVREYATGSIQINQGMGRSAYLCPSLECVALAAKKKRLERALKSAVPSVTYDLLTQSPTQD